MRRLCQHIWLKGTCAMWRLWRLCRQSWPKRECVFVVSSKNVAMMLLLMGAQDSQECFVGLKTIDLSTEKASPFSFFQCLT